MTSSQLREILKSAPLVASAQASPGSVMASPETLDRLARASVDEGCRALRLEGTESIRRAKAWFSGPVLGLVKRAYPDSEVYITPTLAEVEALLAAGVEVIAADATPRPRPNAERLEDLIAAAHRGGALVMADIDSEESARFALKAGADILSTTLSGYTSRKTSGNGPDLALIREIRRFFSGPLLAEGRYQEPWQAKAALGVGADGVVIGGALNDPNKQTRRFLSALLPRAERVGAVDLGGTWLRFGVFDSDLRPVEGSHRRQPLPATRAERLDWIEQQARSAGVDRLGISSGGTLDPHDQGHVWEAKDFIPDHRGTRFVWPGLEAVALNDGLANAWGLSHTPVAAGRRVVGLALGTGVGAGLVSEGRLHMGPRGEYPRWNDLPTPDGRTVEEVLGGLALTADPPADRREAALQVARFVLETIDRLQFPEVIILSGGVGESEWFREGIQANPPQICTELAWTEPDSGLRGAAALALHPPF